MVHIENSSKYLAQTSGSDFGWYNTDSGFSIGPVRHGLSFLSGPMSDDERAELARLKEQQARLERELSLLSSQLKTVEQRLTTSDTARVSPHREIVRPSSTVQPPETITSKGAPPSTPPVLPPRIPELAKIQVPVTSAAPASSSRPEATPPPLVPEPEPMRQIPAVSQTEFVRAVAPAGSGSFEMRLGTYWFVRIGVIMVLTALVFFGNLAYHTYISRLGPGGKVFLLYVASALMLSGGWWWQRKAGAEGLKNYAQVLFAGGMASLYFTTYAAHHIERLRVIQSAGLDGVLLLCCAGFMVWIADRKKSEVLALFAVGLAYYSSIITRVGSFTLYSNLVLTLAAVFFLVRNRWAMLTFGSAVASYAAYSFWRFFDGTAWHWASPAEGLWAGTYFLISYWVVFTAGVLFSRSEKFAGENRAAFLTLNNGAFFLMFVLTMMQVQQGGFWKFSLIYGAVLLALALVTVRALRAEPLAASFYLTQGLLLVTLGFISKFSGLDLALILAVESVVLLMLGQQLKNVILVAVAYITGMLSVGWGMDGMKQFDPPGLWLGSGIGAILLVNALQTHRHIGATQQRTIRPEPAYFTVLALVIWLIVIWDNTTRHQFPLVLCVVALALTFSIYVLRVPEITLVGQCYLVFAQFAWILSWIAPTQPLPWWNPLWVILSSLFLSQWWQRQKFLTSPSVSWWQGIYSLAIVGILYCWLNQKVSAPTWLVLSSGLAIGLTVYGVATRAWFLAAGAQIFIVISGTQFAWQLSERKPEWFFTLAPIAALSLLSGGTVQWFRRRPGADAGLRETLLGIAMAYRWVALVMSISWLCEYSPPRERIWLLGLVGLGIFCWAGWKRNQEALLFSAAFTVTALAIFWLRLVEAPMVYLPNLVVILALLVQTQTAKRLPERYALQPELRGGILLVGGLSLWRFVSLGILETASGFYLTASWSVLALGLFAAGMALRERMYRWLGLAVLACSLGRVVLFDVWKLETIYRILSFLALGIVLLVLGFIYTKYQEKIKEWL